MLGRRAAIAASVAVLAAVGGGVAFGASQHGSSSTKPHVTPKAKQAPQRTVVPRGMRCHHDGAMMSPASSSDL
jgi:hypothetical protein